MSEFSSPPCGACADSAVTDVSIASFKKDVVEASKQSLVLISFWAAWEPSGVQMNVALEKLARASEGVFRLAKIEVDKNQPIVQQMGVQEIPAVYAVYKGRPVDAFTGLMPEAEIMAWIDRLLTGLGISKQNQPNVAAHLEQAEALFTAGNIAAAEENFSAALNAAPDNAAALAGLARCALAKGDADRAKDILNSIPAANANDKAFDSIRAALELAEQSAKTKGQTKQLEKILNNNPSDHETRFNLALALWAEGRKEEAVDHLLEIVRRNRKWNDDAARKQLLKFFDALGATDDLTLSARKRLSSILFS